MNAYQPRVRANKGLAGLAALVDNARALAGFPRRPDGGNKKADASTSASEKVNDMFESNVQQNATKSNSQQPAANLGVQSRAQANPAYDIPLRKKYGFDEVRVTPEIAQHWLTFNQVNRDQISARKEEYYEQMLSGTFLSRNGQTISFAPGRLLDGQNRLEALVKAGIKLWMLVVWGCEAEVMSTIDTGKSRTARDIGTISGLKRWEATAFSGGIHGIIVASGGGNPATTEKVHNKDIENFFKEHKNAIETSLRFLSEMPRRSPVFSFSSAFTLHYLFRLVDAEKADHFFHHLYHADGLARSWPVYHLREKFIADQRLKRKESRFQKFAAVINAWNATRRNASWRTASALPLKAGQAMPEIQ